MCEAARRLLKTLCRATLLLLFVLTATPSWAQAVYVTTNGTNQENNELDASQPAVTTGGSAKVTFNSGCYPAKITLHVAPVKGYMTKLDYITIQTSSDGKTWSEQAKLEGYNPNDPGTDIAERDIELYSSAASDRTRIYVDFRLVPLVLMSNFGEKASVTFYDGGSDISSFNPSSPGSIIETVLPGQCVVMHIDPAAGYWTDKELLSGKLSKHEDIEPSGVVVAPSTRGAGIRGTIDPNLDVTLIQLDEDRYDGAGWYSVQVPDGASAEYDEMILDGLVVAKFDLSNGTASTDGKTYTYTSDGFTTALTVNDGGTSFPYSGSAQGPKEITNTTIAVSGNSKTINFTPVDKQVKMVMGGDNLTTSGDAVNVGSYSATLTAVTNTAVATAVVPIGIFKNSKTFDFEITKKEVNTNPTGTQGKMSITVNPTSFTYNGTRQVPEVKVYDGEGANAREIPATEYDVNYQDKSNGTAVADPKNAATYTIVISDKAGKTNGNYEIKGGSAEFSIGPKALTITAKDKTIKYGDEAANDGVTYEGFVNSETASVLGGTLSYAYKTKEDGSGDAYTKTSPVGTYYIIPSGLTSANYDITFKAGKLTVSNSPVVIGGDDDASATATIEVSPKEFTYNGKDQKPEVTITLKDGKKVIDNKEYTVTYKKGDTEVSETKDAGTYTVVISNKTGADYAFSGKTTADYTIKPKALTIMAKDKTIKYGDEAANDGVTYEGFVNSETASVLGGTLSYAYKTKEDGSGDAYTKTSPVGTYYIIPSGLTSANYDITFKAGKLTVSNSPVVIGGDDDASATATIEVSPKEFTYNGKDQKPEVKITLKDGNKDIPATEYDVKYKDAKGTAMSDTKNAGTYTLEIANKEGADYAFSGKTTASYTIKQKALTVTAKAKTIGYGFEASNNGVEYSGFVEGESETTAGVFSGTLAYTYNSKEDGTGSAYTKESPVGTYYIIPSGLTSGNYAITYKAGVLTVSDKVIVIGGDDDTDADATISVKPTEFIYNGKDQKPEVTITMKDGKTVISASEYDVKYKDAKGTAVTESKNAGTYTLEITNKEGADYAFSGKTTASYTIKPAELKVTAEAQTKKVGEADPELTYTYEGLVDGDKITGALTRDAGEAAGSYAIKLGTLTAGTNYAITFTGANLTITDDSSVPEESTYYKITIVKTEGGKVNSTHVKATVGQQVNLVVIPDEGYEMSSLVVVNNSAKTSVSTGITYDKDGKPFNYFLMPASDVTVTAIFQKVNQDKDFKQNIFIFRNPYGEVVSNLLYAESGQQVNLETRIKDGFTNVVLDDLYVINEKGEQLQLFYLVDPIEGPVHLFFMRGEKAYVFNSFKGANGIVDESNPLPLDMDYVLYLINNIFGSNFLNLNNGAEGAQVAMSLLANILANVTADGELSVNKGPEDLLMALLNLKSGWKIKIDFTGIIQLLNPEMLGLAKGATLTSGQFYELLTPGNLELLLNSSYSSLLIKSITVVAPETEDPTAISRLQADEEAGDTYDLSGRKVDTSTRLPKGVYIRNGKKIVLK